VDVMTQFVDAASKVLGADSVSALILDEDGIGLKDTVAHLQNLGFRQIVIAHSGEDHAQINGSKCVSLPKGPRHDALTALIRKLSGTWLHLCFNGEFLAYPFAETRSIQDFCGFLQDERRRAAHVTVVDHYAMDLSKSDYGYARDAGFDRGGYYARHSETSTDPIEPIVEIYGGLRWRYEEEFPEDRRTCTRAALFRCQSDLELTPALKFTDAHMNTLQCPWHHSPTAALRSFRAAKYLMINPGSRSKIASFAWAQTTAADGTAQQLMDLGFMEPGQWF